MESLEDFSEQDKNGLYEKFFLKLCMCDCQTCTARSPHMQANCYHECENKEIVIWKKIKF